MRTDRKKFTLYLTVEELEILKKVAKEHNLSTSEYIRYISLNAQERKTGPTEYREQSMSGKTHRFYLDLSETDYYSLKLISTQQGLTMSDYLRNCIRLKKLKFFKIDIKHHDLDKHTMLVADLTKKVESVCNTISASKIAYPQEVAKLIQLLEQINDDNKLILDSVYKDRKKLYLDAKKELLKNIRDA